jgi:hypothetical protein
MTSIPADRLVKVTPTVVPTGGTGLDVQGLFLTQSNRVPIGQVQAFQSDDDVAAFFGASSLEASVAVRYFKGYDSSPIKPANLLFAQYPPTDVAAYLRGGSLKAMTLAQLKAIAGTVALTINGVLVTSGAINLTGATSFSSAATIIAAAFNHNDANFTASQSGNVLTVTAVASGALAVGQVVAGAGVTAGTKITALGTGTGGTGTYTVDSSATIASEAMTAGALTVAFDSVSSAFVLTDGTPGADSTITTADVSSAATALKLTTATGATTSQGAVAATPASAMDSVTAATQDFVTFSTIFQPSDDDMIAFAAWCSDQSARFPYIQWDNNAAMTVAGDVASAAAQIRDALYEGIESIYSPSQGPFKAAFVMGAIASIDFTRTNGRTNIALLSQAGLSADVTDGTIADTLKANGYNYYGAFGTANADFLLFNPGSVTGPFLWMDSLINSIWMTNAFQLSGMTLLTTIHNIPYNAEGYATIDANFIGVIDAAVRFGAIRAGVPLDPTQAAAVNAQAGLKISDVLTQRGWYLQILPASPQVRSARGSPPMTFWYTDGQSVQQLNLNTAEVQ